MYSYLIFESVCLIYVIFRSEYGPEMMFSIDLIASILNSCPLRLDFSLMHFMWLLVQIIFIWITKMEMEWKLTALAITFP